MQNPKFIHSENLKKSVEFFSKHQKKSDFINALDTNKKFIRGFHQITRIEFEKMRRYSGSVLVDEKDRKRGYNTTCCCGSKRINSDNSNYPVCFVSGVETGKTFFSGLMKCGSVWRCPVCGFKIIKHRQNEIYFMSSEWLRQGFEISFITLTIRHKKTERLPDTLKKLLSEFNKFQKTKVYKRLEKDHQIEGFVKTTEITWGFDNGWHPHLHLLVFHKSKNFNQLHKIFIKNWTKRKEVNALQKLQRAKQVYNHSGVVEYVTKWDMTKEMTQANFKQPKGKRFTPFSILRGLALNEFENHEKDLFHFLFLEYCRATKGKHFIVISKKMKEYFRNVANEEIKSDTEILENEQIDEILFKIDCNLWDKFIKEKKVFIGHIVNGYENLGLQGVLELFSGAGYDVVYNFERGLIYELNPDENEIPPNISVFVYDWYHNEWKIRRFCRFLENGLIEVYCNQFNSKDLRTKVFKQYSFDFPNLPF